jgi:radical S-adenosyl methionine domain-containing protein 2
MVTQMQNADTPALPDTINLFILAGCNFRCKHCYATFDDLPPGRSRTMSEETAADIIRLISREPTQPGTPPRKITFVGGEPTLCPYLPGLVAHSKRLGLATAVITNGSRVTQHYLKQFDGHLDWLGISIDSVNSETNRFIGRHNPRGKTLSRQDYLDRARWIKEEHIRLKINTVVSSLNWQEDMSRFIATTQPSRWKILQVTPIAGQNDVGITGLLITTEQFQAFVSRHSSVRDSGITLVPETVELIQGSYVMISPEGCFFENIRGRHIYSQPILEIGINRAWQQIIFDGAKFRRRGGIYDPFTRDN